MLKECTILTFNEVEELRHDLDHLIDILKEADNGEREAVYACSYALDNIIELRKKFD